MKKIYCTGIGALIAIIVIGVIFLIKESRVDPHYIPEYKVSDIDPAADMPGLVVYKDSVYVENDYILMSKSEWNAVSDTFLGSVRPNIDEYTKLKDYGELMSTTSGNIYTTKTYSDDFRIASASVHDGGEIWVVFYEKLNGIMVESGRDLFENLLQFKKLYTWDPGDVYYQSEKDRRADRDNQKNIPGLDHEDMRTLYDALMNAVHVPESERENAEWAGNLYIKMSDSTTVGLSVYHDNLIGYRSIIFRMDDPIYDRIAELYEQGGDL